MWKGYLYECEGGRCCFLEIRGESDGDILVDFFIRFSYFNLALFCEDWLRITALWIVICVLSEEGLVGERFGECGFGVGGSLI